MTFDYCGVDPGTSWVYPQDKVRTGRQEGCHSLHRHQTMGPEECGGSTQSIKGMTEATVGPAPLPRIMANSKEVFVHCKGALQVDREKARDQLNPSGEPV